MKSLNIMYMYRTRQNNYLRFSIQLNQLCYCLCFGGEYTFIVLSIVIVIVAVGLEVYKEY